MKNEYIPVEDILLGNQKFAIVLNFLNKISKREYSVHSYLYKIDEISIEQIIEVTTPIEQGDLTAIYELYDQLSLKCNPAILDWLEVLDVIYEGFTSLISKLNNIDISPKNELYIQLNETKNKIKYLNEYDMTDYQCNVKKLKKYFVWDNIHWGKYSGSKISDILDTDADYILWCIVNLGHFTLMGSFFLMKNARNNSLLLKAVEINEIKKLIADEWEISNYDDYDNSDSWDNNKLNDGFEEDNDTWNHYNQ